MAVSTPMNSAPIYEEVQRDACSVNDRGGCNDIR
jgi:hypothetical protein